MFFKSGPVARWFGYSRRERRASLILLGMIAVIIAVRYVLPESNTEIEYLSTGFDPLTAIREISPADTPSSGRFAADYNDSISVDTKNRSDYHHSERVDKGSSLQNRKKIDINSCDSAALVSLPGIGPVLSSRIIRYRKLLGGYARTEQLKEVYGLPAETYDLIRERVYADSSGITRIKINSAGYRELSRIHYLEKYELQSILKFKELNGRVNGIGDLTENKILTEEKAYKIEPYIDFE